MYIIGISAFYHDSSVCLFKDGELIFACEEEKFTGIKHDSSFPYKALEYIYKEYNITKEEVESVCYYEIPFIKKMRVQDTIKLRRPLHYFKSLSNINNNMKELKRELRKLSPRVHYSWHHTSHLYYSFFTSPFEKAMCLSIDGVGEKTTISYGIGNKRGFEHEELARYPHSLGLYYSAMTAFIGFKPNEGEYKVMGLASYGNPFIYIDKVRELITYDDNKLRCDMDVFTWDRSLTTMFNKKLSEKLGIVQRFPDEVITQTYEDLAASIQMVYEEILFKVIKRISVTNGTKNLCLSGGCAYNGSANGKITENTMYNHLWIPPSPSDSGSAIGACIDYMVRYKKFKKKITNSPFLGPSYSIDRRTVLLNANNFDQYESPEMLVKHVAKKLKEGKVVGWFQGNIEFGSRALGNRSILADPTIKNMKDRINSVIKKREGFRPFAPMVIKEKQSQFFIMDDDIPYMNQVVKVKPEYIVKLPAVTHIDGTARVQTVYNSTLIHSLLIEFEKLSGYPILLNTSFNVKDKTMVLTPDDAFNTFHDTDIDILVIDNYVIYKTKK